ncbi:TRAP-type C4-dicarboxylate transport system substrate-binding protein [Natranaerovirga hydrolytica]|uniref:TRAP-type C4-dicarboxylate transport system substrate-binding protein n=2 Tax=Natranaerovirga hydrolytica TaxID=680378 RepID=A0A4R1N931_9FIRM|nr:TRAP-type C4-dicarboxylate transport system substrate-binding protein [Natranaerovirga hydrolytica]
MPKRTVPFDALGRIKKYEIYPIVYYNEFVHTCIKTNLYVKGVIMNKNIKIFVVIAIFVIGSIFFLSNNEEVSSPSTDSIIFRLAETMPKEHPSAKATEHFANLVYERSDGAINIKIYYDEELGNAEEILDQIQFGGIAMARVNALDLTERVHTIGQYFDPHLYSDADTLMNWIEMNHNRISEFTQIERIHPLVWYYPDTRCFYSDKIHITNILDFQNKNINTVSSGIMRETMGALGAQSVEIQTADTYQSLNTGYMDLGETTLSQFVLSDYYNFIRYVTLSEYIANPDVLIISTISYASLNNQQRELIESCAQETYAYQRQEQAKFAAYWIDVLEEEKELFIEDDVFKNAIRELINTN